MVMDSNRMLRKTVLWVMAVIVVACVAMTVYAIGASLCPVAEPAEKKNQKAPAPANNPSVAEPLELPEQQWLKEEVGGSKENLLT